MADYTKDNRFEIPDPCPVSMPAGYKRPETLEAMIARMMRVSEALKDTGAETFEEADDFDVDDDGEINSPYQMSQMQEEYYHEPARAVPERPNRRASDGNSPSEGSTKAGSKPSEAEPEEAKPHPETPRSASKETVTK